MPDSIIGELAYTLKFDHVRSKPLAMKAMTNKIYRQDHNESNIYVLVDIKEDRQLEPKLKHQYQMYDLMML